MPEMVGMAIDPDAGQQAGGSQADDSSAAALQAVSQPQLREACRVVVGGARGAVTGIVPGTEKQPVQLADVRAALVAEQLIDA